MSLDVWGRTEGADVLDDIFSLRGVLLVRGLDVILECFDDDVEDVRKDNIKRAKDSTIVALVKKKYKELQEGYKELQEENDNLKANTKLTKIKEIQIQTEVLQEEMQKMKKLYKESCIQNQNNIEQLSELKDIKNKFAQQHQIIQNLQELCDNSSKENKYLKNQIDDIKIKSSKKDEVIRKQKIDNQKTYQIKCLKIKAKQCDSAVVLAARSERQEEQKQCKSQRRPR